MFNLIKRFKNYKKNIKEKFLTSKNENTADALILANLVLLLTIYTLFWFITLIFYQGNKTFGVILLTILTVGFVLFSMIPSLFLLTMPITTKILFNFFGKYGYCVSKTDWKFIKKNSPEVYKFLKSRKSIGTCYLSSWLIAIHLKDAELMYLGYGDSKDSLTGHAVVVKGNIVYDTNARMHFYIHEYIEEYNAKVFKIYVAKTFKKKSFFEDIREEFTLWCSQNKIHCEF